jgi:prepilin-type N-terminal cleavage/methylation domain-containing protein
MKSLTSMRNGFTLLEMAASLTLISLVTLGFAELHAQGQRLVQITDDEYELATDLADALRTIEDDFTRSGFVEVVGEDFPQRRTGADAETATMNAPWPALLSPDSTEFELVLPADANDDDWPDLDAQRELVWDATRITYSFEDGGDGRARIVRRVQGGQTTNILTGAVRFVFEDPSATGWTIPMQHVRVSITAERVGARGFVSQRTATRVFRLPNGGLAD